MHPPSPSLLFCVWVSVVLAQIPVAPAPSLHASPQDQGLFYVLLFGAGGTILMIVNGVLYCISFFRRTPPIESEFATKAEMEKLAAQLRAEMKADRETQQQTATIIFQKLDTLNSSVSKGFQDIQRDLGKLEGRSGHA